MDKGIEAAARGLCLWQNNDCCECGGAAPCDRYRAAARAAVIAYLRAWEPSEQATEAALATVDVAEDDDEFFVRTAKRAARAEADRLEQEASRG